MPAAGLLSSLPPLVPLLVPPLAPVLVTGANGFLGRHLVAGLLARGYRVRVLVRPAAASAAAEAAASGAHPGRRALPSLRTWPVEYAEGDLTRPASVADVATGCAAIIHAAAQAQVIPARDPAVWATNHTATATLLALAHRAGVGRLVYVGTANVFGFGPRHHPGDENCRYAGHRYGLDYMDSKRAATDLVQRAVAADGLPAVLVHPTFMVGPGDAKPTSNALLLALYHGRVPGYPAGGKNYVHVTDVATATLNALTMGRIGESYILGHENLSYREAFALIAAVGRGARAPRWPVPAALARLYTATTELRARLGGPAATLNAGMTALTADGHYFTAAKARAELALPQTPVAWAVADAFAWFRAHSYV